MWEETLSQLPSGSKYISETLERQLHLRQFNLNYLKMEQPGTTALTRLVGMGNRVDPETKQVMPVTQTYPSYFRNVVAAFELLPITKYFGITIKDAMAMPVNEWYNLRDSAVELAKNKPPDEEQLAFKLLREMMNGSKQPEEGS